ncbi:MAG: phosphate ABC transporter permease subunit PstC [Synergistaceae bacterium]
MNNKKEQIMKFVFMASACISIVTIALMCIFLFSNTVPTLTKIGIRDFILGTEWKPSAEIFGIFPMIIGSLYVTAGAIIIGVPIGILSAIYIASFCPKKYYNSLKSTINLLAGIPSIVFGFWGLMVIVPLIRENFHGSGTSILAASIVLGIMILPTVINISESSIKAVPESYYESSLALGASHERSIFYAVVPAAKSGIAAALILGIGRALGETLAIVMIAGNQAVIPSSIFKGARTLTSNIVLEMGYAQDLHRDALIATGTVLFIFILLTNMCFNLIKRRTQ